VKPARAPLVTPLVTPRLTPRVTPLVALLVALLAPALACAAAPPQSVATSYDVYRNGLRIAVMNETFEARGADYRLVSESRAVGLLALFKPDTVRFVSTGRITADGLQPLRFEGKRREDDPRQVRGAFDWQAGRLSIEHDGRSEDFPVSRGAQDRLSILYQFMFLSPRPGQRLDFSMTNGRKLGQYQYLVQPNAEIDTPLGRLDTLHIVKQHKPDETGTELWISPRHRNLAVKVLIEEDGVRYEQIATRIEIGP
jgi:hypothetical protein